QGTPYVPELMVQVFGQVQALELAATFAANEGQLDHGSFNSGAVLKVYDALVLVDSALRLFADECISQIKINEEVCRLNAELSTSLSTMVSSLYGYPTGVKIAKLALAENISCKEATLKENILPEDVAEELFNVKKLTDRHAMVAMFEKYKTLKKVS
ncbi:MAG: lyase, partial [Burkholderiaceae bacterium]|nr:lyase [Burkholderiaceae bacterium]